MGKLSKQDKEMFVMGLLKERAHTLITAKLVFWRELSLSRFEGRIAQSINPHYIDDRWVTMQFVSVRRYPALTGHWDVHLLGMNAWRQYFVMYYKDER